MAAAAANKKSIQQLETAAALSCPDRTAKTRKTTSPAANTAAAANGAVIYLYSVTHKKNTASKNTPSTAAKRRSVKTIDSTSQIRC